MDLKSVLLAAGLLMSLSANATVILSTDFDDRTVSGDTASDLAWVANGVTNPGALTVSEAATLAPTLALFNTAGSQDRFAVDRNLHNEGSWFVDLDFNVQNNISVINLESLSFDSMIFNNSGAVQGVQRDLDMGLELFANGVSLFADSIENIFAGNGTNNPISRLVSFDLSGQNLTQGNDYTLRLTASGAGPGNNAGFDNLNLSGTVVSEPSMFMLMLLGFAGLVFRKAKR